MPDASSDELLAHDLADALTMSLTAPAVVQHLKRAGWSFFKMTELVPADLIALHVMKQDARAALRMIREVVEDYAPTGSVPSEEDGLLMDEAQALVRGIIAIAEDNGTSPRGGR
jgi:hypothetical protein